MANGTIKFIVKYTEEIQVVTVKNLAKVGNLEITKTGEVLVGVETDESGKKEFKYEEQKIDTAEFDIYAKEDIVHPDGQTGIIVKAGTKVSEGHTENGVLKITHYNDEVINTQNENIQKLLKRGLALGKYEIKETKAPQGYYLDPNNCTTEVEIKQGVDDKVEIETAIRKIYNERQTVNTGEFVPKLTITKKAERDVYKIGEEAKYSIIVKNEGTTNIKDIEVKETLADGSFEDVEETNIKTEKIDNQTIKIEKLKSGEEIILTYRYVVKAENEEN